jgi:hypothetical protein
MQLPDRSARWLGGLAVVSACSWGRWLATGSLRVDENYPGPLAGTALFVGLVLGWSLLVWGWHGMLSEPPPTAAARRLAFAGLIASAPMLPILSNDAFSLLAYGSLAAHGRDVYVTAEWLPDSAFVSWVGERWKSEVCVYGPTTLVSVLPAALVGPHPWMALALLRLSWLPILVGAMELSFRRLHDRPLFHTMVWLNPLLVVEGLGQLHADVLGVALLVAGIVLRREGRARGAGLVFYVLAVLGKYTFLFAGPWFWLFRASGLRQRLARLAAMGSILVALGVVFYAPFWHGFATLTVPLRALGAMKPGGSITEVAGHLVHVLSGGPMEPTWRVVSLVLRVVFVGVVATQLAGMLRARTDEDTLALGTGAIVVAAITLASHRFQSWYLMAALPFFGLRCEGPWKRWWLLVVPLSVATEFVHVLPRTAALLPAWSVLTNGGVVIVFLWAFRARFLRVGRPQVKSVSEPSVAAR